MEIPPLLDDVVPRPILDKVFLGYYVCQIVTTLLLDMQGTFPSCFYPSWLRAIHTHHVETWRDPWLANTLRHPWYFAICMWEYSCHIPFYFLAAYAYFHGTKNCRWIRIPVIIYCTQTMTAVSGIILMAFFEDFSSYTDPHPTNLFERGKLALMYSLFFFLPLLNIADALSSKDYVTEGVTSSATTSSGQKKTK